MCEVEQTWLLILITEFKWDIMHSTILHFAKLGYVTNGINSSVVCYGVTLAWFVQYVLIKNNTQVRCFGGIIDREKFLMPVK